MKKSSHFKTGLLLFSFSILAIFYAQNALGGQCIRNERDLSNAPAVRELLNKYGGITAFQGIWEFPGVLGTGIGKKKIVFQSRPEGLKARVGDKDFQSVLICTNDKDKNILEIQILEHGGQNVKGVVLMKPTKKPGVIKIAAEESNWKFYEFNKDELLAMSDQRVSASVPSVH